MAIRKNNITRSHHCASGGIAQLTYAKQEDGSIVVLRELLPRYLLSLSMHKRFVKGTRIRSLLSPHPYIIGSIARGHQGLRPYEIIEYVPGYNLAHLIRIQHHFIAEHRLQILQQTAVALLHVHQKGFLHLDVKAENLVLDPTKDQPLTKLTDFDLSRRLHHSSTKHKGGGTRKYMAPETAKAGIVDQQTDIFAFGILGYYLFTWRMPFYGNSAKELEKKQFSKKSHIKPLREIDPEITPKIEDVIMGCLEKHYRRRIPSMAYVVQELQAAGR